MVVDGPRLRLQAEKVLQNTIRPHLLAYCSRTDLLAVVSDDEVVDVYRIGGQRAFSIKRKSPSVSVVGLQWVRNGKCLAIALSNGHIDIVSGETGKIIRHGGDDPFATDAPGFEPTRRAITCLGWGTTLTSSAKLKPPSNQKMANTLTANGAKPSTEDWYDKLYDITTGSLLGDQHDEARAKDAMLCDLPRQLASTDIELTLPRLSPIPSRANAGGRYDMFATQVALDDYFLSMQAQDKLAADIMLVGHDDGQVRIIVDDIVEVSHGPKGDDSASGLGKAPLLYSSHPQSSRHALLFAVPEQTEIQEGKKLQSKTYRHLSLNLFTIPLLSSGGSHLHLIVSMTAQIRDLCNYISYSILCAKSDWNTHTNLPSRFMENINETLDEKDEGTLEQNLQHLAMSGNLTPTILEWLRDELAERGHKRWDHAMTTLYSELGKIFQTNLLPVLERCMVVAIKLRGLARYYEDSKKFDVAPQTFTDIIGALSMLQILVHEAIQVLGEEQRQFRAFSRWLRHQIDLAAADPESVSARDMAEREASNLDLPKILAYLEGPLTMSRLKPIVHAPAVDNIIGQVTQQDLIKAIVEARSGSAQREELLSLHTLSAHLNEVCRAAHSQILRWQNSVGPVAEVIELGPAPISNVFDMRMISRKVEVFEAVVIVVPHHERNKVLCQSISDKQGKLDANVSSQTMIFAAEAEILSVKFLDDDTYITLIALSDADHHLVKCTRAVQTNESMTIDTEDPEHASYATRIHTFSSEEPFVPAEIVVNGRKGRETVCVVDKDYRQWKTFDLEAIQPGCHGATEFDEDSQMGIGEMDDSMAID